MENVFYHTKKIVSEMFSLNKIDWIKIGKGALVAGAGTVITYLLQAVSNTDFGQWTPVVVSLASIVANILRKFLTRTEA